MTQDLQASLEPQVVKTIKGGRGGGRTGGGLKMQEVNTQTVKMTNQVARHGSAGHEIAIYFSILEFLLWQATARSVVQTFSW